MSQLQWKITNSITEEHDNLFSCPSSIAISHRHNKIFVATYDDIDGWGLNTCIQVFNIVNEGGTITYLYQGRMLVNCIPRNLLCVSHDTDDSLIVTCSATYSLYRFEISNLLENAFDDDHLTTTHVWRVNGVSFPDTSTKPVFGFASAMDVALDENGDKIIFVCDGRRNRIAIISFKDGSVIRFLTGIQRKNNANEDYQSEHVERPEEAEQDEGDEVTTRYSFGSVSGISVKQSGNEYTLIVSQYTKSYKIILNSLMSTDIIETEMSYGPTCAIDSLSNQILFADCESNEFRVVDLDTAEAKFSTQEYGLQTPQHVHLDRSTRTLYIVNEGSIKILNA